MSFDEAHFNFHTAGGRYRAFAELLTRDGYRISPNRQRFSRDVLRGADLLVIANALGAADVASADAEKPAFTEEETRAVAEWVRAGGTLLLITDHQPTGAAARSLAGQFGVEMSNAIVVDKTAGNFLEGYMEFNLEFTRANGRLRADAITTGRDSTERVQRVVAFGGQSLRGRRTPSAFSSSVPLHTTSTSPPASERRQQDDAWDSHSRTGAAGSS